MRKEQAVVSLATVCISLFQCQSPAFTSASRLKNKGFCGATGDHRGDVLVPFYKGSTTYKELAGGLEYRLNQYCVLHSSTTTQARKQEKEKQQQECAAKVLTCSDLVKGQSTAVNGHCNCCFNGSYLCSCCAGCSDALCLANVLKAKAISYEYPRIVVCAFTREREPELVKEKIFYEVVDGNMDVTEGNLHCFFYFVMEKHGKKLTPIIAEDGSVRRPLIGRDHVRLYASDSAYGDSNGVRQHIEVKVGARLFRIATSAEQRFEDVFKRLRTRNLHVQRFFDGATGASILPCELVRHLSWKVSVFCADVLTPVPALLGVKRPRADETLGVAETECEEYHDGDVGTLISLSDVGPDVCVGSTVSLSCDHFSNNAAISAGDSEGRHSWHYEQLLQRTTFGFESDDETVSFVDAAPFQCCDTDDFSVQAIGDDSASWRPFCLGDDSYTLHTSFVRSKGFDQGGFTAAISTQEDNRAMIESSDGSCSENRLQLRGEGYDAVAISPFMVTQQSLPDFILEDADEEEDDS